MKRSHLLALLVAVFFLLAAEDKKEPAKLVLSDAEKTLLELTNKARADQQLPPLRPNPALFQAARTHSANMAKKGEMNHVLDGNTPAQRAKAAGYEFRRLGENIALWPGVSPAEAMKLWLNSPGHRANILNADYTEIGLGLAPDATGGVYYTQVFGSR